MLLRNKKKFIHLFLLTVMVIVAIFVAIELAMYPLIKSFAAQSAKSMATYIIGEGVCEAIENANLKYSDLVKIVHDDSGKIIAVNTDSFNMNKLKSNIAINIYSLLISYSDDEFNIPLGNVFNSSFLSGKGPEIRVCVKPSGAVQCDYRNVFTSAGINQTNHRIMLDIEVTVNVIMPFRRIEETVCSTVCIADTVIVGEVPQAFTNVQNFSTSDEGETVADEVVDFGAHNFLKD